LHPHWRTPDVRPFCTQGPGALALLRGRASRGVCNGGHITCQAKAMAGLHQGTALGFAPLETLFAPGHPAGLAHEACTCRSSAALTPPKLGVWSGCSSHWPGIGCGSAHTRLGCISRGEGSWGAFYTAYEVSAHQAALDHTPHLDSLAAPAFGLSLPYPNANAAGLLELLYPLDRRTHSDLHYRSLCCSRGHRGVFCG